MRHVYLQQARNALAIALCILLLAETGPTHAAPLKQDGVSELTLTSDELILTLFGEGVYMLQTADGQQLTYPGATSYTSLWEDGNVYASQDEMGRGNGLTQIDDMTALETYSTAQDVDFTLRYRLVHRNLSLLTSCFTCRASWLR